MTLDPTPVTEIGFTPSGDLSVTNTDSHGGSSITSAIGSVVPGMSNTYTIVASNSGPTAATGVSVTDPLSLNPDITSDTWTAVGAGGATGFTGSGSSTIADSLNLPAGSSVTYTVVAVVNSAAMGTLSNTATITSPPGFSDTNPGNNSATDSDLLAPDDGLTITKIDDAHGSVTAGTPITYTIVVTDEGPSDTSHLSVVDSLPSQGLTNITSPNLPAGVTFSPTTDNWTMNSLPTGQSVTLQLAGTVPSGATGATYTNTATASATDAPPTSATDTDTLTTQAALTISKTDGVPSVIAGNTDTYSVVVSNTGPSDASNLNVVDNLPSQGFTAISSPNLPTGVIFNSTTDSWSLSSLPAGQSVTLKLSGVVPPAATGTSFVNTATASASDAAIVTATDTDALSSQASLAITKTDSLTSVTAGTTDNYTITVSNTGPSTATSVNVVDTLPAQGLINISTPNLPTGVSFNSATSSWTVPSLAPGTHVTLLLAGTVPSGATGATYVNTATASASDATTVTATDTDSLTPHATLAITKTDNDQGSSITSTVGSAVPGTSITYTIVASNSGPSTATGVSIADPLAVNPAISSDTWTATASGGATGFSASGSGSISDSATIPSGGSVTYTVVASIKSSATGTLANTATATATDATTVTATDSDSLTPHATLAITKTDGVTSVTPGTTDTYIVVVSNSGPSDAAGLSVADTLPVQGLSNISSPSLPAGVTFNAATDTWSLASLASGQSVTLQLAGTVPSGATGSTYVNTATASATDASTVTATDSDSLTPHATLAITKTDGVTSVTPGTTDTYTVVVSNSGPSDAASLSVVDTLPTQGLTNISSPNLPAGVTFNAATDTWSLASLASGQSVTLQLSGTVPSGATGSTYVNTATASAADATTVSATDSDTLNAHATLAITKTDGVTSVTPGTTDTYTIAVSNTGPSDAAGLSVADTLPTQGLSNVSSPNLPAGVTFNAATDTWSVGSLASGQSVTLQLSGTVPSGATGSTYVNTATASASDASTVSATDTDSLNPHATLSITKTDSDQGSSITSTVGSAVPGTSITYTIVASNSGPSTAVGASVTDPLALNPAISSDTWTATASGGTTGFSASGTGNINDSLTIPSGGSVTYTVVATIKSSATGTLANTATATASDATTVSATDSDSLSAHATLAITKTDGVTSVTPGTTDTYTIVVSNTGPSDAAGLSVADTLPAQGLSNISSPSLPAGVTFNAATDTWSLASLASGQSVTLQLSGTVPSGATGSTYVNTATAAASDASTVSATDSDSLNAHATLAITKTDGVTSVGSAVPGTSITYTIVASNSGPSDGRRTERDRPSGPQPGHQLSTPGRPPRPGGPSTPPPGTISDSLTIPSGGSVTYTVVATIRSSAIGTLANTATASAADASTVTATDTDTLTSQATLTITKTDSDGGSSVNPTVGSAVSGTSITYTIVASNSGPSTATGASVTDPIALNPAISSDTWTATASGGTTGFSASGSGSIDDSLTIPSGGSVAYTVVAAIRSSATGTLANTATATASEATTVTATDSDSLTPHATVAITKTDNDGGSSITPAVGTAIPGTSITYTIVASNSGPSTANGLSVADTLPTQGFRHLDGHRRRRGHRRQRHRIGHHQ